MMNRAFAPRSLGAVSSLYRRATADISSRITMMNATRALATAAAPEGYMMKNR